MGCFVCTSSFTRQVQSVWYIYKGSLSLSLLTPNYIDVSL